MCWQKFCLCNPSHLHGYSGVIDKGSLEAKQSYKYVDGSPQGHFCQVITYTDRWIHTT